MPRSELDLDQMVGLKRAPEGTPMTASVKMQGVATGTYGVEYAGPGAQQLPVVSLLHGLVAVSGPKLHGPVAHP
jgi:hypothetical protein